MYSIFCNKYTKVCGSDDSKLRNNVQLLSTLWNSVFHLFDRSWFCLNQLFIPRGWNVMQKYRIYWGGGRRVRVSRDKNWFSSCDTSCFLMHLRHWSWWPYTVKGWWNLEWAARWNRVVNCTLLDTAVEVRETSKSLWEFILVDSLTYIFIYYYYRYYYWNKVKLSF